MILVGRASLFATPIARGTQQGAAGERGIAGPEEEILLVMATLGGVNGGQTTGNVRPEKSNYSPKPLGKAGVVA